MTREAARLGPFVVHEELARGGMGVVLRAAHSVGREGGPGDAEVAIKVVIDADAHGAQYLDDFRQEVQAAAQLTHPHIVTLLDYGTVPDGVPDPELLAPGSPYLAMELADAGSLHDHPPADWPTLRSQLLELLDALGHAHAHGVVHRDLKPGNVLLHRGDGDAPKVLLADFGIAHASDHRAEGQSESIVGTVAYMAPEQIETRWRDFGPWTDLYALGIMTHQLVSGSLPFTAEIAAAVLIAHLENPLPKLFPRFHVPAGLAPWIRRLCEKPHHARFERAADAAHALRSLEGPIGDVLAAPLEPLPEEVATRAPRRSTGEEAPTRAPRSRGASPDAAPRADASPKGTASPPWSDASSPGTASPPWSDASSPGTGGPPWSAPSTGAPPWASGGPSSGDAGTGWGDVSGVREKSRPALPNRAPLPESWRRETEARATVLHGAGLGLYFLRTVPMIDREGERDAIWSALRSVAEARRPRALVLRGPTGTGKSRLAEHMTQRAHELGAATILRATHARSAGPTHGVPRMIARCYGAVGLDGRQLEKRLLARLERDGVRHAELEAGALVELLGGTRDAQPSTSAVRFASPAERYLSTEGVLSREAEARPVIVWLDDVQWGGDAIALTQHALDHVEAPVLFVLTAQDEALAERDGEREALEALEAHDRADTRWVGPLSPEDTAALVEGLLGLKGTLADRVVRRVDGNPLFAVQLVGDWVQRGVLQLTPNGFGLRPGERGDIPDDLHVVWTERIERVLEGRDASERALLELAAVLGISHDEDELAAVCEAWGAPMPAQLLDDLARARMIERGDTGWAFVHAMLRESLVQRASRGGRAAAMHGTCADVIRARGGKGSAERRATHLAEAGREEEAIAPFLEAATELRDGSDYARALAMLAQREELLAAVGADDGDARWGEGWVSRADVHRLAWDFQAARTWAENARSAAEAHEWPRVAAEAALILANVARQQGEPEAALDHVRSAREGFHRLDDDDGRARALLAMAILSRQRGEYEAGAALYARAFALFEMTGDERGAANAMLGLGHTAVHEKQYETAQAKFEAAQARCEAAGYRAGLANCLMGRADVHRNRGELDAAEQTYRRAHEVQKSIGSKAVLVARLNLGLVLTERGEHAAARRIFDAELPGLVRSNKLAYVGWLHCIQLWCTAAQGDGVGFDAHLTEARALTERRPLVDEDMAKSAARAMTLWRERGDTDRAEAARVLAVKLHEATGDEEGAAALANG